MVPDDRSGGGSFDFNSQAGVLAVLGAIRASTLTTADRNELRDLVFLYSNGGGDPAVRTQLEERLREYAITPIAAQAKPLAAQNGTATAPQVPRGAGFSTGRPAPVFVPVTPTPVTSAPAVNVPVPEVVTSVVPPVTLPVAETPVPVVEPRVVPVVPAPVKVITPIVPEPIPPIRPIVTIPAPAPEPVASVSVQVPPSPSIAVPPIVDPISPTTTDRLERIRQIKSDVNNRVGNPVNLVAMNKAVGGEYMSALLDAMKLLSSASESDSARAMTRLEASYKQVLELIEARQSPVAAAPIAPVIPTAPTPIAPVMPVIPTPTPTPTPTTVSEPLVSVPPVQSTPVPPPAVQAWGAADTVDDLVREPVRVVPVVPSIPEYQSVPPAPVSPVVPVPPPSVAPSRPDPIIVPPVDTVEPPASVPSVPMFQSVAAAQAPLRSITELPTADQVNSVSAGGDPLATKEVDAGLNQLLSEWMLFKKSGLFGAGPHGVEHPLFKKLAPLQIPLILAGRFEGATQEIKQSITDYMNGWRYEQGIVYEKDETFERYLRRVIRHIIDLQKAKRGS